MATNTMSKSRAQSYLKAIQRSKKKIVSISDLALSIGIFEEVIRDHFATFDPMIRMMPDINVLDYVPQLEKFIENEKKVKPTVKRAKRVKTAYKSLGDFVYQNMTIPGGIVDSSIDLSFEQIKELKKIVNNEYKAKKPNK